MNTWACLAPLSTAGVSEKTASVATASCLLGILSVWFLDFQCFFIGKVLGNDRELDLAMCFPIFKW